MDRVDYRDNTYTFIFFPMKIALRYIWLLHLCIHVLVYLSISICKFSSSFFLNMSRVITKLRLFYWQFRVVTVPAKQLRLNMCPGCNGICRHA